MIHAIRCLRARRRVLREELKTLQSGVYGDSGNVDAVSKELHDIHYAIEALIEETPPSTLRENNHEQITVY